MITRTYTIYHGGYALQVTATFYPATIQTMEQPGEPAAADIIRVQYHGVEVHGLSDSDFEALESEWLTRWFEDERDYYTDNDN